ncbi:hypothetical protein IC582_000491 [Cucumis melo]
MEVLEAKDLLEAQSHVWNQIFIFTKSMAFKCAVQLGIPDAINCHGPNPMPLSRLVSALELPLEKTPYIYRLMRVLVHSGFFLTQKLSEQNDEDQEEEEEDHGYVLTNSSRLLVKTNPLTLAPFLFSTLTPPLLDSWSSLPAWLQSEDQTPPFESAYGVSFWEYMGSNKSSEGAAVFDASLASDAKFVVSVLMEKCKGVFDGVGSLVDVGGGTGNVTKCIAQAFPQMECTVFDLPQVVADLKAEGNLKFWVLHDWSDEECVKILKKCKEAINRNEKKGKVMVIDMVVGNNKTDASIETQLFFDMMVMLMVGGKERDEKEWAHLIIEAGFSGYNIFPILGLRSLIEIYP